MAIAAFTNPSAMPARRQTALNCLLHAAFLAALAIAGLAFSSGLSYAQPKIVGNNYLLPESISEFRRGDVTDYESRKAGLGFGVAYYRQGWRADVYIYDMGQKSIPSGPKSDAVAAQMKQAKAEIYEVQKLGHYTAVSFKSDFHVTDTAGKPAFTCMGLSMQIVRKNMQATDSYLCLTGNANKFVKVRISGTQDADSEKVARRFVGELANIIAVR